MIFFLLKKYNFNTEELGNWDISLGYSVKFVAGILFLLIYSNHYGNGTLSADAGKFLDESRILNEVFYHSPSDYFKLLLGVDNSKELVLKYLTETHHWDANSQLMINDNRNILRIHSLIQFFSFNQMHIHLLVFSLLSFLGSLHFYQGVKQYFVINNRLAYWILLCIPSVLFWSSSILKEPLMLLGLGLFVHGLLGSVHGWNKWRLLLIGAFLLIMFKPYVLLSILPGVIFFTASKLFKTRKIIAGLSMSLLLLIITLAIFSNTRSKIIETLSRKQYDFINVSRGGIHLRGDTCFYYVRPELMSNVDLHVDDEYAIVKKPTEVDVLISKDLTMPQQIILQPSDYIYTVPFYQDKCTSYIELKRLENSMVDLIIASPAALFNTLFRPLPGDPGSTLVYPAMLENILLIGFLIFVIIKRRTLAEKTQLLIISMILFCITLSLLIGWVTPVLGAINRYRIPVLLVLVTIGLIVMRPVQKTKT